MALSIPRSNSQIGSPGSLDFQARKGKGSKSFFAESKESRYLSNSFDWMELSRSIFLLVESWKQFSASQILFLGSRGRTKEVSKGEMFRGNYFSEIFLHKIRTDSHSHAYSLS